MATDAPTPAVAIHPAVFIASLCDYNNGLIHGWWISALIPEQMIQSAISEMLASSPWTRRTGEPAEEWVILDHEGFPPPGPGPHESAAGIVRLARGQSD